MAEGGCECGAVRYRMSGDPIFVNCCHCRDCQKITGSAFAVNAMIEADRIEILEGQPSVEAGAARCSRCKALLWAEHPQFGNRIKFVRVGTLDEGERFSPDAHFFVRSKHPWVVIPEGLPAFEALPGDGDPPLLSENSAARVDAARR
ncbi:MAG: GFA family protein [Bacillota bacterium]